MVKCPHCGSEVPDGKKFCGYCGRQLEQPPEGPKAATPDPANFDEDAETQLLPLEEPVPEPPAQVPEPEATPAQPDAAPEPVVEPEEPLREPLKPSASLGPASKPAPIPETSRRKIPAWIWVIGALLLVFIGWRLMGGAGASPAVPTEDPYADEAGSAPPPTSAATVSDWGPIEGQVDGMDSEIILANAPDYFDFYADFGYTKASNSESTALQFFLEADNGAYGVLELFLEEQLIGFSVCDRNGVCDGLDQAEYAPHLAPEIGDKNRVEIVLWNGTLHYYVNDYDLGGYAFLTDGQDVTIGAFALGEDKPEFSIDYGVGWP